MERGRLCGQKRGLFLQKEDFCPVSIPMFSCLRLHMYLRYKIYLARWRKEIVRPMAVGRARVQHYQADVSSSHHPSYDVTAQMSRA